MITQPQSDLADRILATAYWGDRTLEDPAWRTAFDQAPRAAFAPATWYEWTHGTWVTRWRGTDPQAWAHAVHTVDAPLITHLDGHDAPACSLSAPILVAAMLGGLQLEDGMRVLESGTGLGWTAALLSARVGSENVVSVEFDPELAAAATLRVRDAGFRPLIEHGDGEAGWGPDRTGSLAPYDRACATHAVTRIPPAWIEQTRPGGLVCAPLKIADRGLDLYVQLTVNGDGSASGPVLFPVAFMPSRTGLAAPRAGLTDGPGRAGKTSLDLPAIINGGNLWVLQTAVPGLNVTGPRLEDGDDTVWVSTPDGSWAVAYTPSGAPWEAAVVEQHGPADVWTAVEAAWASWDAAGRPGMDEYELDVAADGTHRIWGPAGLVATLP